MRASAGMNGMSRR